MRVAGAGHSFSDIALTDGAQLRLDRLTRVLDVDRSSGLVRVQAGITIRELSARLAEHGLALENLGDIDAQSIAGAISTATHGTGARLRNIAAQVVELTLVLADGSLPASRRGPTPRPSAPPASGSERSACIAEVTLRCVPAFTPARRRRPPAARRDARALRGARARQRPLRALRLPPRRHRAHAHEQPHRRAAPPARALGRLRQRHPAHQPRLGLFCRIGRRFPSRIPQINRLVTRLAGATTRVDRSDRIFASPASCASPRWSTPSRAPHAEAVRRVMALVPRRGFDVPFPIEVRTVAADDALLSTAPAATRLRRRAHVSGHDLQPYFRAVETIMDDLDGRPHWGKRHFQSAATLRRSYPDWDRFQAIRARLDPTGASPTTGPTACSARRRRTGAAPAARPATASAATRRRRRPREHPPIPERAGDGLDAPSPRLRRPTYPRGASQNDPQAELAAPGTGNRRSRPAVRALDLDACGPTPPTRAARRPQADPPRQQVAPLPRAADARARPRRGFAARSPSRCPRLYGSREQGFGTSRRLPHRRPGRAARARASCTAEQPDAASR